MKLLTYRTSDGTRTAIKTPLGLIDVAQAAESLGLAPIPASVHDVMTGGEAALKQLRRLADNALSAGEGAPWLLSEESLDLAPCVPNPGKIICVGLNYRKHAEEAKMPVPESPILFSKFTNALAGNGDPILSPADSTQLDYEAELVIVIGKRCRSISREEAFSHIFGYCAGNDLSARDLQFRTNQWLLGKSCDTFCPIGPYLVTADEVSNPGALGVRCFVNGELRQDSNTSDLIFPIDYLISYASAYMTLEPGDIILTGTPAGVAMGMPGKPWLQPGDRVTVEIDGLGSLTNVVGNHL